MNENLLQDLRLMRMKGLQFDWLCIGFVLKKVENWLKKFFWREEEDEEERNWWMNVNELHAVRANRFVKETFIYFATRAKHSKVKCWKHSLEMRNTQVRKRRERVKKERKVLLEFNAFYRNFWNFFGVFRHVLWMEGKSQKFSSKRCAVLTEE